MFDRAVDLIHQIATQAWTAIITVVIIGGGLVGVWYLMQALGGSFMGAQQLVVRAIIGIVLLFIVIGIGFVLIPQLVGWLMAQRPAPPF